MRILTKNHLKFLCVLSVLCIYSSGDNSILAWVLCSFAYLINYLILNIEFIKSPCLEISLEILTFGLLENLGNRYWSENDFFIGGKGIQNTHLIKRQYNLLRYNTKAKLSPEFLNDKI